MERYTYSLEQINDYFGLYQGFCDKFLELAFDNETKAKLESILYKGEYKSYFCDSNLANAGDAFIEAKRRLATAYLLLNNPDTFDYLSKNQVNLFHGTNANALPFILKYGLNSEEESLKLDINITTGEFSTRRNNKPRDFVSFTDVLDIAEGYSTLNAKEGTEELSFQVVIGITENDAKKIGRYRILSTTPEVGVRNKVPLESIKVIMVPSSKLEFVRRLVGDLDIKVLPIHSAYDKFYYVGDDPYSTEFDIEKFEEMKENLKNKKVKTDKIFSLNELKTLMVNALKKVFGNSKVESEEFKDGFRKR